MKIYTLFLNTQNLSQVQYKPNKITANDSGSVYWGIDWDNLFGINHKYTTAKVNLNQTGRGALLKGRGALLFLLAYLINNFNIY